MFSYFAKEEPQTKDLEQNDVVIGEPVSQELQQIDAYEKQTLCGNIDANKYVRRRGQWEFRKDWGVKEFALRIAVLLGLFFIAYFTKPGTPRGREDREWLILFSLVMMIWFACLHTIAYLPAAIFGGFSDMIAALKGQVGHAYQNWRDYQYIVALILAVVVLYPFVVFFSLIYDGFDPYDELTHSEKKLEGGLQADICYIFRVALHTFLLIVTVYMFLMLFTLYVLRHIQRYPGQYTWIVVKFTRWPYGALFFQEGEYFDCAICLEGIWTGNDVCRLNCSQSHVFHAECLRKQVSDHGNKYCVLCHQPISVQNPPEPEPVAE